MISMAKNVMQVQVLLHKLNYEHVMDYKLSFSISDDILLFIAVIVLLRMTSHPFVSVSESDYLYSMVMDDY